MAAIADRIRLDPGELAAGLREIAALSAIASLTTSGGAEQPAGLLAAAHDRADEQVSIDTSVATRIRERAAGFWEAAPATAREERDVEAAAAWAAPLALVVLPRLDRVHVQEWLLTRGVRLSRDGSPGRPLDGLLVAARGAGLVFVDPDQAPAERRFTAAHEIGHFVLDYLEPRERVLREAPSLLEVVDGWRRPTPAERAQAVLARVPLGLHAHLLERDVQGGAAADVEVVEDTASQFALELLAPWANVLDMARATVGDRRRPYAELHADLTRRVAERFAVPSHRASVRAAAALEALGVHRSFFDR